MPRLNVNLTDKEYNYLKTRSLSMTAWIKWIIQEGMRLDAENVSSSASIVEEKENYGSHTHS